MSPWLLAYHTDRRLCIKYPFVHELVGIVAHRLVCCRVMVPRVCNKDALVHDSIS